MSNIGVITGRKIKPVVYFKSLRKYLLNKQDNTALVVIALTILSNSLGVNLDIWNELPTSTVYRVDVTSVVGVSHRIAVHHRLDHYNGIIYKRASIPLLLGDVPSTNTAGTNTAVPSTNTAAPSAVRVVYSSSELKQFDIGRHHIQRSTRKRLFKQTWKTHGRHSNLINISLAPKMRPFKRLSMCSLNCQSAKNKSASLQEYISSNDFDLVALTETWLGSSYNKKVISELIPEGYKLVSVPRKNAPGGGVALLQKAGLSVKKVSLSDRKFSQFEYLICNCVLEKVSFQLSVLYRPPPTKKNGFTVGTFFDEMSDFLEYMNSVSTDILITGDLNFHLDVVTDPSTVKFTSLLQGYGLCQLVLGPMHRKGHTLDVVVKRDNSSLVSNVYVSDPALCNDHGSVAGDHFAVLMDLSCEKPKPVRKLVTFRKYCAVNIDNFKEDMSTHLHEKNTISMDSIDCMVDSLKGTLLTLADKHAPLNQRVITLRPNAPWFNAELADLKTKKRKAERFWQKTQLSVHHQMYRESSAAMNRLRQRSR